MNPLNSHMNIQSELGN